MRSILMAGLALVALAALPGRAVAQAVGAGMIAPTSETMRVAAELRLPGGQVAWLVPAADRRMIQARSGNRRQGEILMIVGAAGIVTGLLVNEDLVTVAGAGVGGFGLYRYLQGTR